MKWLYMFLRRGRIEARLSSSSVSIILFLCFYKIHLSSNLAHTVAEKENNKISAFLNVFNLYILETAKPAKCFLPTTICTLRFKILKLHEATSLK